ncbi:MAG: hypothetical protein Q8K36_05405 [Alphaproteobacteria bacterium]|nr:hypothetical protein [Alphaproteobacteria bacterium]
MRNDINNNKKKLEDDYEYEKCINDIQAVIKEFDQIVLIGDVGRGKTHLINLYIQNLSEKKLGIKLDLSKNAQIIRTEIIYCILEKLPLKGWSPKDWLLLSGRCVFQLSRFLGRCFGVVKLPDQISTLYKWISLVLPFIPVSQINVHINKHNKGVVIYIDNIDILSPEYRKELYKVLDDIEEKLSFKLIVSISDENFLKKSPDGSFFSKSFSILLTNFYVEEARKYFKKMLYREVPDFRWNDECEKILNNIEIDTPSKIDVIIKNLKANTPDNNNRKLESLINESKKPSLSIVQYVDFHTLLKQYDDCIHEEIFTQNFDKKHHFFKQRKEIMDSLNTFLNNLPKPIPNEVFWSLYFKFSNFYEPIQINDEYRRQQDKEIFLIKNVIDASQDPDQIYYFLKYPEEQVEKVDRDQYNECGDGVRIRKSFRFSEVYESLNQKLLEYTRPLAIKKIIKRFQEPNMIIKVRRSFHTEDSVFNETMMFFLLSPESPFLVNGLNDFKACFNQSKNENIQQNVMEYLKLIAMTLQGKRNYFPKQVQDVKETIKINKSIIPCLWKIAITNKEFINLPEAQEWKNIFTDNNITEADLPLCNS